MAFWAFLSFRLGLLFSPLSSLLLVPSLKSCGPQKDFTNLRVWLSSQGKLVSLYFSLCTMANSATRLPFKFITHNVQGLNSPVKWRVAFQHYKSLNVNVLFLQETHFPPNYNLNFLHHCYPHFYLNGPGRTGGVGICFSKRVSFSLEKKICDPEGRCLVLVGHLEGSLATFSFFFMTLT